MALHGPLFAQLHAGILDAFPSEDPLRLALRLRLGVNPELYLTQGKPYALKISELIESFEREGRLGELLDGLRVENSGNSRLRAAEVEWCAARVSVVPRLPVRNHRFVGRASDLARLGQRLAPGAIVAVTGMPGVGKTDLVLEYVYLNHGRWSSVTWCNSETLDDLLGSYAAGYPCDVAGIGPEIHTRAAAFRDRLRERSGWLLVLDNVTDWRAIADWVPSGPGGCVVVTARLVPSERLDELVVDLLPPGEAAALMIGDSTGDAAVVAAAHELSERFGRLPLALNYGRGLISAGHYSVEELLVIHRKGGLDSVVEAAGGVEVPLRAAIRACVERARGREPLAAEALLATAFLCPDGVPEEVLREVCGGADVDVRRVLIQVGDALLRRDPNARLVRVHRVIQDLLLSIQPAKERGERARRIVGVMARLFPVPGLVEHWKQCERLRATATACARWVEALDIRNEQAVTLLHRLAYYLDGQGLHFAVEPLYDRALDVLMGLRAADDPAIAELLNHIGWMYRAQGSLARAEEHYRRAWTALQGRDDGESRRVLASTLHNWATLIHDRGRFAEALPLHEEALAIRRKLGGEDAKTALSLSNLGWLLAEMGRLDEADARLAEALRIRRACLSGAGDHPDIATTQALQGYVLRRRGRPSEAKAMYLAALAMRSRHLGADHPRNASILNELGEVELELGDRGEAARCFERAQAVLAAAGLDRVADAAWWRRGRARLAMLAGRRDEALQWYAEALARGHEAMSDAHPDLRGLIDEAEKAMQSS